MQRSLERDQTELDHDVVGTGAIVFMVLAAAAPIGAMAGSMPLGVAFGNGATLVGTYVLATVVLLLFAVGFAAMSRHVAGAGAFYSYVTRALGRVPGAGTAGVALLAYNAMAIALAAAFGAFAHGTFDAVFGIDLPWWVWLTLALVIVAVLGYREITLTAKALAFVLVTEVAVLGIFDVAVLLDNGFGGFSLSVLAPSGVLGAGAGLGLTFAFSSYVGFEATAIYSEEARHPERTVARATFIALAIIGIFYTLTTWAAITSYGTAAAQHAAVDDTAGFLFTAFSNDVGSPLLFDVMQVLVVTSLFASLLAFHQGAARYMFATARDGLLPPLLERVHPRHGSPYVASALQLVLLVAVVVLLSLGGGDPYLTITAPVIALGTLGVIVLQASTSIAVVAYFRRTGDRRWWTTLVAPGLAALGLVASVVLVCVNFGALTGSDSTVVGLLPWLLLVAFALGALRAAYLRRSRPVAYDHLGASHGLVEQAAPMPEPAPAPVA